MGNWFNDPVKAAVIGAVIGALLTNIVIYIREEWISKPKQKKREQKKLATALYAESESLMTLYEPNKLENKVPENGSDIKNVRISCNYIAVFENNTDKIGILNTADIKSIIDLYITIKALIDTLLVLADRWELHATSSRHPQQFNSNELDMQLEDVRNTYKIALQYQTIVFELYPKVKKVLSKYMD